MRGGHQLRVRQQEGAASQRPRRGPEHRFDAAEPSAPEALRLADPTFLARLRARTSVAVHGFAIPEGPAGRATAYNASLACHRALDAKAPGRRQ